MDIRSFLDLLNQEKRICDRLQSVRNMLGGLMDAARENRTSVDRHSQLVERLNEEAETLGKELTQVRREIRDQLVAYECEYGGDN